MESLMARKMWRTLEPYHGMIYFVPEAPAAYAKLGVTGLDGYFASRSAPMGAVPAEVVVASFFNFDPTVVHAAIGSNDANGFCAVAEVAGAGFWVSGFCIGVSISNHTLRS